MRLLIHVTSAFGIRAVLRPADYTLVRASVPDPLAVIVAAVFAVLFVIFARAGF
jgi:hypothetical protein